MTKKTITNVVATASVNQEIDFKELRKHTAEIVHNPDVYAGRVAYFKQYGMQGRISIFSSGKMISVGTKSEENASKELMMAKDYLVEKRLIKNVEIIPVIQNVVVSADLEKTLDIEKLSLKIKSIYEPEQFPGLILHMTDPCKTSVLIFASGKVVITGLKGSQYINAILQRLVEICVQAGSAL